MNILNIVSIVCFALCLIIFFYLRWFIKKRTTFSGLEDRKLELAQLINDIDRITDRDAQLIEDRVNQLKTLLHDVDKRIAVYERELENFSLFENNRQSGAKKNETLYSSLGLGIRAALAQPDHAAKPPFVPSSGSTPVSSKSQPDVNSSALRFSGEDSYANQNNIPKEDNKTPSKMQIRSTIDNLAKEGLSSEEIANRLNISAAEVNLAMNLRSGRRKN
ncbi:MAG: hypothetical protein FWC06_03955 [Treponema sp.]|nr:hypothetical protein [Treponema sp.]